MIYVDHNMRRALELCALATQASNFEVRSAAKRNQAACFLLSCSPLCLEF